VGHVGCCVWGGVPCGGKQIIIAILTPDICQQENSALLGAVGNVARVARDQLARIAQRTERRTARLNSLIAE